MDKILITGGAGFIASHIVDAHIQAGHDVVVIDNLVAGKKEYLNKKAKFYKADIGDCSVLEKIFAKEKPDVVSHHAALTSVSQSLTDPLPVYTTNVIGTLNMLAVAGRFGIKKFIFASSIAVYGEPKKIIVDEQAAPAPISPYGLSKLLAETAVMIYARIHNFNYLIFRYANVYGPRQNPNASIVPIFTDFLKNNRSPIIFGDGTKGRDYIYVSDVASANLLALKKGTNEIIGLGRGLTVSDQEVFETIRQTLKSALKSKHDLARPGEIYRIANNPHKAKKVLGWQAKISFAEGVRLYIKSL